MKLIRFKVNTRDGFRSFQQGFEIYFLRDFDYSLAHEFNPNVLAGRNGSGKSNILEALANIFYHLDCMYSDSLPAGFLKDEDNITGFDNTVCVVDAFELEYFIDVPDSLIDVSISDKFQILRNQLKAHIVITKEEGSKPVFEWVNQEDYLRNADPLGKMEVQKLLPKYVLGYSSGENELLSLPFFKTRFLHYDEYADKLTRAAPFGYPPRSDGRLVYLDNQISQAILLSNFLMQSKATLAPFIDEVELDDISEFRLIICLDEYLNFHEDILRDDVVKARETEEQEVRKVQLTHNLRDSIEVLKKCATCYEVRHVEEDFDEIGREYLYLDYKVTAATKDAFRFHFSDSPLQLFQLFQILLELDSYVVSREDKQRVYRSKSIFINHDIRANPLEDDRILRFKNLWIKKKGIERPIFTKELSDGEHQFLHSLGLCLLFKDENCLFLLDEPETHFNPDWKAKFISSVRHCFAFQSTQTTRDMLITTHSPYLISDSEAKYVHIFEKDTKTKKVKCSFPEFQTLGTSVNKITMRVFDKADTIGEYANRRIDFLKEEFKNTDNEEVFLAKVRNEIGDSVESVLFINDIMDKIEEK